MDNGMKVSIIVAMGSNYVIGKDNTLPWCGQLSADMKHFRELTMDHPIVMGRNTYESLPRKPLPGRLNIVVTSQREYNAPGCLVVSSFQEVLDCCRSDEVVIIGGVRLYLAALPLAHQIYLTLIHQEFEGDVRFPKIDSRVWKETKREDHEPDERNLYRYSFLTLVRK